jgi:hypothetical protein
MREVVILLNTSEQENRESSVRSPAKFAELLVSLDAVPLALPLSSDSSAVLYVRIISAVFSIPFHIK